MNGISNDEDKIVFFHDYISSHNAYDPDGVSGDVEAVDDYSFTAYGTLVKNLSVCQGMSDAFILLCKRVGIDSVLASSEQMVHAWNLVRLNNRYYHLDITWDDSIFNANLDYASSDFLDVKGFVSHNYFMKSDSQMLKLDHYGWNKTKNAIDSSTFNNYYWNDVNSNIYYIKGFRVISRTYCYCIFAFECGPAAGSPNMKIQRIFVSRLEINLWTYQPIITCRLIFVKRVTDYCRFAACIILPCSSSIIILYSKSLEISLGVEGLREYRTSGNCSCFQLCARLRLSSQRDG